jgi:glycosyltransferase involved in cell wall biosynthesis
MSMHNAAGTIELALRCLQAQTWEDWELILIDDGSTDDCLSRARRLVDERIRIVADGRRRGLAARLNQAIDLSRGRYLARADADDISYPERFARQRSYLETHPEVDLLGAGMMVFAAGGGPVGLYHAPTTHEAICARPLSGFYLPHPTWMGRTEWFRSFRYDPVCRKAQDQDLLLRAWRTSRYAALPEPLVGYRQDAVSARKSLAGRYYFSRAILRATVREARLPAGIAAVAVQGLKLAADTVAIGTGLARTLLKHRARPCTEAEAERWRQVWAACGGPARNEVPESAEAHAPRSADRGGGANLPSDAS